MRLQPRKAQKETEMQEKILWGVGLAGRVVKNPKFRKRFWEGTIALASVIV